MRSNSISCSQLIKNQKLPWSLLIKMSLAKEQVGRKDSILPLASEWSGAFFFSKKIPPPEDPQNKFENYRPATQGIVTSLGEGIKGRLIHPLEGSYPLIPYSAASDACSGRCVNPAAKNSSVIFSPDYVACSHCAYPLSP
jgi:hypothetical protein